ncbi:MAG: hypothetical protein HY934_00335 [Candidatus Firestonebacteria bacterium]|nr:hypothetical protein [Candidatus Firestonebacteria bacterium]
MSLDKIFDSLDEEAVRQREDLLVKAKSEAEKIIQEAEEESQRTVQSHIEKMNVTLRGERARIQIVAELDRKRKIIKAKEDHSSSVFLEVEKNLKAYREKQEAYKKVLKGLLIESLNEVKGKNIIVIVDKKDEALANNILKELNLNHEIKVGDDCIGGISLQVDGNRVKVFNTFESRLDKAKKIIKTQLTEVLFGA